MRVSPRNPDHARTRVRSLVVVERAAWTDERLDDLAETVRAGFSRVDQDFRDLRSEMHEGLGSVRDEINSLRHLMLQVGGGMLVGFISVLAAILVRGP